MNSDFTVNMNKVKSGLSEMDITLQLVEEIGELAQAAAKLPRAAGWIRNPTPRTEQEVREQLREEGADVMVCLHALGITVQSMSAVMDEKAARWAHRLEERESRSVDISEMGWE